MRLEVPTLATAILVLAQTAQGGEWILDRYGREVCAVLVGLRDVGLEQIRQGMAWHYKAYQHEQPHAGETRLRAGGGER